MTIDDPATSAPATPSAPVLVEIRAQPAEFPSVLRVAARLGASFQTRLTIHVLGEPGSTKRTPRAARVADSIANTLATAHPEYAPGRRFHEMYDVRMIRDKENDTRAQGAVPAVVVFDSERGARVTSLMCVAPDRVTTEWDIGASTVPVVSVADGGDVDPLNVTVVATDFSVASWDAAEIAFRAVPSGATVHVVHALHDGSVGTTMWRHAVEAAVSAWCAPLGALLPPGTGVRTAVLSGDPTTALQSYLGAVGATCVAVGGHRRRPNRVAVVGHTVPEQIIGTWRQSLIVAPYRGP